MKQILSAIRSAILVFACLGWFPLAAEGREFFRAYDEQQGLLEPSITALAQDSDGFLYVGTLNGLFRYDGSRFTRIPLRSGAESPVVLSLMRHPSSGVWVGTLDGLAWVRGLDVAWTTFEGTDSKLDIHGIGLDASGTCWVPNRRGMFVQTGPLAFSLDPATAHWHPKNTIAISPPGGDIAVLDGDLILHRRDSKGSWNSQPCPEFGGRRPSCLTADRKGRVWCVLDQQLWRSDAPGARFVKRNGWLRGTISQDTDCHPDPQGGIWVPTERGLLHLDDGPVEWIDRAKGLPEAEFNLAFVDALGNLWYGGQGLYRRLGRGWFQVFSPPKEATGIQVCGVHHGPHSGQVYAATQKGLYVFDGTSLRFVPGTTSEIYSLEEDALGDLWITTKPEGYWRLKRGSAALQREQGPGGVANGRLVAGPGGTLYLHDGTQPAFRLLTRQGQALWEKVETPAVSCRKEASTEALAFDAQARLWTGSSWGLQVKEGQAWATFTTADGLRSNSIIQLVPEPDGSMWIRYEEPVGISRVTVTGGKLQLVEQLDAPAQLPTGNVLDLATDGPGGLWILTSLGVVRRKGTGLQTYNRADGFPPFVFHEGCLSLDRDGTPWIGAGKYLVTCPAGMPPPEIAPPSARITAFATARQTWLLPSLTNWGDIRSKEASLNFQFATWGSEDQGSERVQVWLEGHEETWRDTSQDSAQYSHLREGKYTFHVRAARRLGPWGPEQTLVVRVLPPWYRTTTAMLVGLLLLIVLLRGWFVFRLRRLVAQRRALEAEVKARTIELDRANQALREQSLTDPLTGLKNRRYLQAAIHQDLRKTLHRYQFTAASARRGDLHNPDIIFFMVDIDHFKKVNDGWGHAAGDAVLGQLAEVLQRALRDTDSIVRWGGEEFLVVARDSNRLEGPRIAERICSVVRGHSFAISGSQTLAVTCSVGFTPFPCDLAYLNEASWEQVVDLADQCLYLAKRSGRNGWVGITEAQDTPDLPWEKGQLQKLVASEKVALLHSFSALSFD